MVPSAVSFPSDFLFFIAAYAAIFVLYWYCSVEGRTPLSYRQVLVLGLFARLCMLPMPVSDDMARFLWEGRILALGFDPYSLAPNHPLLAGLRDANWSLINHPNLPTLYPPLALGLFALLAAVEPSELLFKGAFILLDVAGLGVLALALRSETSGSRTGSRIESAAEPSGSRAAADRAMHSRIAAVYFLNPLLILEVAGHGHYESLPLLFCLGFLLALKRENALLAATFLFLAAASKIAALALLPILLMRFSWRRGALTTLGVAIAMAILIRVSGAWETLGRFATDFRYNDAVPFLLRTALGRLLPADALGILSALLLVGCGFAFMKVFRNKAPERQALAFMGLLLAFSPTLHPWYVLWVLPFAAPALSRPWLLLTGTAAVTYAVNFRAQATGRWREIPWLRIPEFFPPVGLWIWERRKGGALKRDVKSQSENGKWQK